MNHVKLLVCKHTILFSLLFLSFLSFAQRDSSVNYLLWRLENFKLPETSSQEDFKESMEWIKGKTEQVIYFFDKTGSFKYHPSFSFDQCYCSYKVKYDDDNWSLNEFYLMDLSKVTAYQPDSKNGYDYYKIRLETFNSKYSIASSANKLDDFYWMPYMEIYVPKNLDPSRLENALRDVIKMCGGGKKEKY